MLEFLTDLLTDTQVQFAPAGALARGILIGIILLLAAISNFVVKRPLLSSLKFLIGRSKTTWDDVLVDRKVFDRLANLAPALVIYVAAPVALEGFNRATAFVQDFAQIYLIITIILVANALLNAGEDIYRTLEIARRVPITGFVQILKIAGYLIGGILIFSVIFNKTPLYLLSGMGALTAVLMLVFKDPILGFVGGLQLTANKMLAPGDWIEMAKYGADGDVIEVGLTTVKVQNWDKTITTIPTYALISDSFKNWRGMQESGGRRIKRSIHIDLNTIRFCTEEMLERFVKIQYIREYLQAKTKEIGEYNATHRIDTSSLVNGRRLTNIGTFRAYITAYLKNHPMIRQDMTFLVRQLPPGEHGLPIEIYVFCKDIAWANYEAIQADIFDHILAVVPEFDLRIFQTPTGSDFRAWGSASPAEKQQTS